MLQCRKKKKSSGHSQLFPPDQWEETGYEKSKGGYRKY